jgi:hypothetical protein
VAVHRKNPALVRKLILSSGAFDDTCAAGIMNTRLDRLSHEDRRSPDPLVSHLNARRTGRKTASAKTRFYEILTEESDYKDTAHKKRYRVTHNRFTA